MQRFQIVQARQYKLAHNNIRLRASEGNYIAGTL